MNICSFESRVKIKSGGRRILDGFFEALSVVQAEGGPSKRESTGGPEEEIWDLKTAKDGPL
jgi:hypothetical protein